MKPSPALAFIASRAWAMEPSVFSRLVDLVQAHAAGERVDAETISSIAVASGAGAEPAVTWQGRTAIVPMRGIIARYADRVNGACQPQGRSAEAVQADLLTAAASADRIIMRIDSPGGEVAGTAETAEVVRRISASGVPVIAFVDGMAASAAYWIASQADEIVASAPTAEVGSIGVATTMSDLSESAKGRLRVITSAPAKASPVLNEAQLANISSLVSDLAGAFADAVAAGRGLTAEQSAAVATGEVWTARQALALGLIDRIASLADVLGALTESPTTAPAAAGHQQEDADMALTTEKLAALIAAHPHHAALIAAEAVKADASDAGITALIAGVEAKAKDAELVALKERLAAAEGKAKSEGEARATAEAALAQLKAHIPQAADPGPGDPTGQRKSRAEVDVMPPRERAAFYAAGGTVI